MSTEAEAQPQPFLRKAGVYVPKSGSFLNKVFREKSAIVGMPLVPDNYRLEFRSARGELGHVPLIQSAATKLFGGLERDKRLFLLLETVDEELEQVGRIDETMHLIITQPDRLKAYFEL